MDFSQFRHILKKNNRYILVENGQPSHIIIPIEEYNDLVKNSPGKLVQEEDFERINREVDLLNERGSLDGRIKTAEDNNFKDIQIEDLPF